jgi:NAD(P)-dependent dehydrogenase (short-subunit alcohol dehydrogenase family)
MPSPRSQQLESFPPNFRALVIGASGGIGAALLQLLVDDPRCALAIGLGRATEPAIDFDDEDSIGRCADCVSAQGPFHLIVNASGVLKGDDFGPEKSLEQLDYRQMAQVFRVNTFGPALLLAQFAPLLAGDRSVLALLSAKVGSIGDNRLGGWYSYRASKAALNMIVKTASIEVRRKNPKAVLLALHPGTVSTKLSTPFRGAEIGRPAPDAAADLLRVIDRSGPDVSGSFFSYHGERLPW